jgi:hypothetical protein
MPKIAVEIEWDYPKDSFWLNVFNIANVLHSYCPNTHFVVRDDTGRCSDGTFNPEQALDARDKEQVEKGK